MNNKPVQREVGGWDKLQGHIFDNIWKSQNGRGNNKIIENKHPDNIYKVT